MDRKFYDSGASSGFQYERTTNTDRINKINGKPVKNPRNSQDDDLIIEENTIYEIDRECFERLKRQKKRKGI